MPDYDLNQIGSDEFENLVQALLKCVIGPGTITFGAGPDGAREATYSGRAPYPSTTEQWDGDWVFEAKYHDIRRLGERTARQQVVSDLDSTLMRRREREQTCDNYILATNVPLSGTLTTGTLDKIDNEIRPKYPEIRNIGVWGYDEVCRHIDNCGDVRDAYLHLITPGDLMARQARLINVSSVKRIDPLRASAEIFVAPTSFPQMRRTLEERGAVVIFGEPQTGKSMSASFLALQHAKGGLNPAITRDADQALSALRDGSPHVVVLDDLDVALGLPLPEHVVRSVADGLCEVDEDHRMILTLSERAWGHLQARIAAAATPPDLSGIAVRVSDTDYGPARMKRILSRHIERAMPDARNRLGAEADGRRDALLSRAPEIADELGYPEQMAALVKRAFAAQTLADTDVNALIVEAKRPGRYAEEILHLQLVEGGCLHIEFLVAAAISTCAHGSTSEDRFHKAFAMVHATATGADGAWLDPFGALLREHLTGRFTIQRLPNGGLCFYSGTFERAVYEVVGEPWQLPQQMLGKALPALLGSRDGALQAIGRDAYGCFGHKLSVEQQEAVCQAALGQPVGALRMVQNLREDASIQTQETLLRTVARTSGDGYAVVLNKLGRAARATPGLLPWYTELVLDLRRDRREAE